MAAELPRSRTEDGLSAAFELKGSVSPLTVLRLRTTDLEAIEKELRSRIAQLPQMFHNAPVVLDLGALDAVDELAFEGLAGRLRACQMVPVAISNAAAETIARAASAGFGHLQLGNGRARTRERAPLAVVEPPAPVEVTPELPPAAAAPQVVTAPAPVGAMTIRQPVRGGQVIYARGTDLVILAPVNPGAQVIADGNIHIYAPLRGRALAGAQGNADTRIFCQSLDAELVSVAGEFLTAEDIPAERRRKPSQILLDGGRCKIVAL